jgi:predicted ArsR family transcriptional regulator
VVGTLHEPVRRRLYLYVLGERRAVSRDDAAGALGVRRGLAAFHLDRLAAEGLLEVEYRRLSGRTGPGAGRPAKLYAVPAAAHEVSLPPRAYDLVAELLAEAVEAGRPGGSGDTAEEVAERHGRALGLAQRGVLGSRPTRATRTSALLDLLARLGYQPSPPPAERTDRAERTGVDNGHIRPSSTPVGVSATVLRNCPFHALAESHRPLVCGMNEALVRGMAEGLGVDGLEARLAPEPGRCCVVLAPAAKAR